MAAMGSVLGDQKENPSCLPEQLKKKEIRVNWNLGKDASFAEDSACARLNQTLDIIISLNPRHNPASILLIRKVRLRKKRILCFGLLRKNTHCIARKTLRRSDVLRVMQGHTN